MFTERTQITLSSTENVSFVTTIPEDRSNIVKSTSKVYVLFSDCSDYDGSVPASLPDKYNCKLYVCKMYNSDKVMSIRQEEEYIKV